MKEENNFDISNLGVSDVESHRPNKIMKDHLDQDGFSEHESLTKGVDENCNQMIIHETQGPSYLKTKVVHNGKIPGDAGHGGRVEIQFVSDYIDHHYGGTIECEKGYRRVHTARGTEETYGDIIKITLLGEWERKQFVQALEQIVAELK